MPLLELPPLLLSLPLLDALFEALPIASRRAFWLSLMSMASRSGQRNRNHCSADGSRPTRVNAYCHRGTPAQHKRKKNVSQVVRRRISIGIHPTRVRLCVITEVHHHKAKIVRERVRDEEPRRAKVLKPDLRLRECFGTIKQREPTIQSVRVQLEGSDTFWRLLAYRVEDTLARGKRTTWTGRQVCHVIDLHASERLREISLLDGPLQQQAVAESEKRFEILRQHARIVSSLPVFDVAASTRRALEVLHVRDASVPLQKRDHGQRDFILARQSARFET